MTKGCPYCDEPLDAGYIVSDNGIYWNDHVPTLRCRSGEPLGISWAGCASVVGHQCKKCNVIVVHKGRHRVRILDSGVCPFCDEEHEYSEDEIPEDRIVQCKNCGEGFVYRE